ncbi:MAG: GHMP kinase [Candidatus Thermoplasmatota archaeon]|jgi:D-glycero-alpha-D-manno-heptose-7-phosphate kinase|nr:GHMP kinase [Candidatus Thermoplasmatota archaeon]MCL5963320.1 GHMP kinase [Candidatus Thermoplasmatota archaeon]
MSKADIIIRCKSPLRISFAGGGTDVSPYPEERGGVTLNATINRYAYATLDKTDSTGYVIRSLDYDTTTKLTDEDDFIYNGELDLIKAVLNVMTEHKDGIKLFLHSDAPPGSGLGSSSTMAVALIGVFKEFYNLPYTSYEIAELAYKIERNELNIAGGRQDQYATTFGGFNFIEFQKDGAIVNPLKIKKEVINELEYRLILCYTGKTRRSGNILNDQIEGYTKKNEKVVKALDETKKLAYEFKKAILTGNVDLFGELLSRGWELKKKFTTNITDQYIDRLYDVAVNNGAMGGKLLGAGGGGHMLFFCDPEKKRDLIKMLEKEGGRIIPFSFEENGMQTWRIG